MYSFSHLELFNQDKHLSQDYLTWINSSSTNKFIPSINKSTSMDDLREYVVAQINSDNIDFFAIIAKYQSKEKHIGNAKIIEIDNNQCMISLIIGNPNSRLRGIGSACIKSLVSYIEINKKNIKKLIAEVDNNNFASHKLFSKLGFSYLPGEKISRYVLVKKDSHLFFL